MKSELEQFRDIKIQIDFHINEIKKLQDLSVKIAESSLLITQYLLKELKINNQERK